MSSSFKFKFLFGVFKLIWFGVTLQLLNMLMVSKIVLEKPLKFSAFLMVLNSDLFSFKIFLIIVTHSGFVNTLWLMLFSATILFVKRVRVVTSTSKKHCSFKNSNNPSSTCKVILSGVKIMCFASPLFACKLLSIFFKQPSTVFE